MTSLRKITLSFVFAMSASACDVPKLDALKMPLTKNGPAYSTNIGNGGGGMPFERTPVREPEKTVEAEAMEIVVKRRMERNQSMDGVDTEIKAVADTLAQLRARLRRR